MWQPIEFIGNDEIRIQWHDQWLIDSSTGAWSEPAALTIHAASSSQVTLSGGAIVVPCTGCVNGQGVGYVGNGEGRMKISGIRVNTSGSHVVVVSYANGDAGNRQAQVNINGVEQTVDFPTTTNGQTTQSLSFKANFESQLENTIEFYNDIAWAPDFDFVRIVLLD